MTDEPTNLADYAAKKGNPWFGLRNVLANLASQMGYKHDGQLDEKYRVSHADATCGMEGIVLEYKGTTQAIIRPAAALSLLSWLEQEKPTLEKMVGVEKGMWKG